ncbi:MAG: hypothetical protein IJ944_02845 [Clostridia bacterium]|nr:hypothetical protein [Clostridia bacterium]
MFPIPFNFPFRKKDGSVTTIENAISGGGTPYTLPTASANTKGGIKIGAGLTMDGEVLNNSNPTPYALPTASDETLGGIKVGDGLSIDENGVLSASGGGGGGGIKVFTYTFPSAKNAGDDGYIVGDTLAHFGMVSGDKLVAIESGNAAFINLRGSSASNQAGKAYKDFIPTDTIFIYGKCITSVDGSTSFGYIEFIYETS